MLVSQLHPERIQVTYTAPPHHQLICLFSFSSLVTYVLRTPPK